MTEPAEESREMLRLLRQPRYFNVEEGQQQKCFTCGQLGHDARNCPADPKERVCCICGQFGHSARKCQESFTRCFRCGQTGHRVRDCPKKLRNQVAAAAAGPEAAADATAAQAEGAHPANNPGTSGRAERRTDGSDQSTVAVDRTPDAGASCGRDPANGDATTTSNIGASSDGIGAGGAGDVSGGLSRGPGGGGGVRCMMCGGWGHVYTACWRGYDPRDMQRMQCYVCGESGHLCCAELQSAMPTEATCYSCGEAGHTGEGCARYRSTGATSAPRGEDEYGTPGGGGGGGGGGGIVCYNCGLEGHMARSCTAPRSSNRHQRSNNAKAVAAAERRERQEMRRLVLPPAQVDDERDVDVFVADLSDYEDEDGRWDGGGEDPRPLFEGKESAWGDDGGRAEGKAKKRKDGGFRKRRKKGRKEKEGGTSQQQDNSSFGKRSNPIVIK